MIHPIRITAAVLFLMVLCLPRPSFAQAAPDPWTPEQLMAPATLAALIADPTSKPPVILDIGPAGTIPGSIDIGATEDPENLNVLRAKLEKLPKDTEVVLYCGCCPYSRCPNVRPAFDLMKELGFKNGKLLDLPHNLKQDWIDKGYPVAP